ncbi:MAG: sugar transferase, partial [Verrucomicrobia bacterium]|nr:sugar transferase [Verrucomicrobiota bacterium]
MKSKRISNLGLITVMTDLLAVTIAYYTAMALRFSDAGTPLFGFINRTLGIRETGYLDESFRLFYLVSAPRIIVFIMGTLFVLYSLRDLYAERRYLRRQPVAWNILMANLMALALFFVYFYLRRNDFHPRSMFATILFFNCIYGTALRALLQQGLRLLRERAGIDRCPAILAGSGRDADYIRTLIEETHPHGMHIVNWVRAKPAQPFGEHLAALQQAVAPHTGAVLIVAEPERSISEIMQVLELADSCNLAVKILSKELDVLATRAGVGVDLIHGVPLMHFAAPSEGGRYRWLKRLTSQLASVGLLIVLSPLLLAIAILVKLTSPGPVFFVQERIGVNRQAFQMWKFRTMRHRADEELAQVEEFNDSGRTLFKMRKDPRVTPGGKWLRRYSLDELPQLLNCIRGDMMLVGPRPLPRRDFEGYYENWHYGRHTGLPGLTCLWQVSGRSELDFHT